MKSFSTNKDNLSDTTIYVLDKLKKGLPIKAGVMTGMAISNYLRGDEDGAKILGGIATGNVIGAVAIDQFLKYNRKKDTDIKNQK